MKPPRRFDDYSALRGEHVTQAERSRAMRHYVMRRRHGMRVPDALQEFILDGLQRQLDDTSGWHGSKAGRPKKSETDDFDSWLDIWAWYCFHMDERFRGGTLAGDKETTARYERISAYLTEELFSLRVDGVPGLSWPTVRRMVRRFKESGFQRPNASARPAEIRDMTAMNVMQARLFCRCTLLLDDAAADELAPRIVERWEKDQK